MGRSTVVVGFGQTGTGATIVGVPALAGPSTPMTDVIDLGPRHPTVPGTLRLRLDVVDEVIVSAEPLVGAMHRGAEKLFEVRDYRAGLALANRHDWWAPFASEWCLAMVIERMAGIPVPPRAAVLRTVLGEVTRIASHLAFLATYPGLDDAAAITGWRLHESAQEVLEHATGGRVHTMAVRVGGLAADVPGRWVEQVHGLLEAWRSAAFVVRDGVVAASVGGAGVAVLTAADALAYAVTGPVARASGVDVDLRRDAPYGVYDRLPVRVVTGVAGDARERIAVRADEVLVSIELVRAALHLLAEVGPGEVAVKLPKVLRVPEGQGYAWAESPAGVAGCYLVSTGARTPWRLKLRTPSFGNAAALAAALPGTRLADLATVMAGWGLVTGDLDR